MWVRAWFTVALRGPGRAMLSASAAGWIALVGLTTTARFSSAHMFGHQHDVGSGAAVLQAPGHFAAMWLAMLVAMAPLLLLREVGYVWRTSLRRLRRLVTASFMCGYLAVWLLCGVGLWTVTAWLAGGADRTAIAIALIFLWHCSPARQHCLNACHRVPTLRLFDGGALSDTLRYGLSVGSYCTATCGPLMLLSLLAADYHLEVMALVTVWAAVERHLPGRPPAWRFPLIPRRSPEWPYLAVTPATLQ